MGFVLYKIQLNSDFDDANSLFILGNATESHWRISHIESLLQCVLTGT